MKRIIKGKTYNTDTATLMARTTEVHEGAVGMRKELYLGRDCGWFAVWFEPISQRRWLHPLTGGRSVDKELTDWGGDIEFVHCDAGCLGSAAELAAEVNAPAATFYVRVPRALRNRVADLAKSEGVSMNAWIMRAIERCSRLAVVKGG
jgi:hypothetical protein